MAARVFRQEAQKCVANQKDYAALNAFVTPLSPQGSWRKRVDDAATRRSNNGPKSRVDGKLVAIKDNICTREFPTTCASGILDKFTSPFNATVVEILEDQGAIVAGKTNLDEFGMGSHSTHSHFGSVESPINAHLTTGGSSGGSAVSVATNQCDAALGTDTGGSVRLPAAYTGTAGFKPSYGRISRWGVVAYANSLDTVGLLARNVSVIRDFFFFLNYPDHRDPTSLSATRRYLIMQMVQRHAKTQEKLRIGVPREYNVEELTPVVRQAWERSLHRLESLGHSIHPVSLPTTKQALSAYYVLAPAEASSNLAKYDGIRYGTRDIDTPDNEDGYLYAHTRGTGFGAEVKRRILLGTFTLSADAINNYFIQAQKVRRLVQTDFNAAFRFPNPLLQSSELLDDQVYGQSDGESDKESTSSADFSKQDSGVDVLVCPTAPSLPPTVQSLNESSPIEAYTSDVFTVPASLAGLPALNVPVTLPEDDEVASGHESPARRGIHTVGMQVIGQYGDDDLVLDVGSLLEQTG